jgi:hypothetical protein
MLLAPDTVDAAAAGAGLVSWKGKSMKRAARTNPR